MLCCFVFHTYCRSELKKLIVRLNEEKKILKEEGINVDGIHYKVSFKGTQDQLSEKGGFFYWSFNLTGGYRVSSPPSFMKTSWEI